ncbi:MAG: 1-acyl-sn-glycerol-3-phosphate acyltransferase [Paludibacter sp.]|nr:MAG: 1-acyl-sn-glycerol-3-phosphate acyltransferase [Paludibacter sp.]
MQILFTLYFWLIAFPIIVVLTVIATLFTLLLIPFFPNTHISNAPAKLWAKAICKLSFIRLETNGFSHLSKDQSYIFVANHQSVYDIFVIYGYIPFVFKWIMKTELRKVPFVGVACEKSGHIFIDRKNPIKAKQSLEKARENLQGGHSVVIFPEGTRTRTGKVLKFKRGAFVLATQLNLPIVPITISGAYERMSANSLKITPGIIRMTVDKPIDVIQYQDKPPKLLIDDVWNVINENLE